MQATSTTVCDPEDRIVTRSFGSSTVDWANGSHGHVVVVGSETPATVLRPTFAPPDTRDFITWQATLVALDRPNASLGEADFPRTIGPGARIDFELWLNGRGPSSLAGTFEVTTLEGCVAETVSLGFIR